MAGRIIVSGYTNNSVSFATKSQAAGTVGSRRVDDSLLIRRAQQGDTAAFEELVRFFFSSRRRHTIWNCDWSSDVCSSDLAEFPKAEVSVTTEPRALDNES